MSWEPPASVKQGSAVTVGNANRQTYTMRRIVFRLRTCCVHGVYGALPKSMATATPAGERESYRERKKLGAGQLRLSYEVTTRIERIHGKMAHETRIAVCTRKIRTHKLFEVPLYRKLSGST